MGNLSSYNNTYDNKNKNKNNSILFTALITINTIFGLQILNFFITFLNNFLRERPSISLIQVGIYAIVTFLVVFLAGFLFLFSTKRILLPVLIALISAARLIIQINPWPPLSLAASALGTVLWMASIVFFISLVQEKRIGLVSVFFPSLFLGFAAATGIYGMFGTWDLIWQDNAVSYFLVFSFAAAYIWLSVKTSSYLEGSAYSDGSRNVFYTLIVFMPFIFLQLYRFQNIAALSAVTGFNTTAGSAIIVVLNIFIFSLIYLFAAELPLNRYRLLIQNLLAAAAFLLILLSFWPETAGGLYIAQAVAGNLASWWLLFTVIKKAAQMQDVKEYKIGQPDISRTKGKAPWKNTSAFGVSGILFFIFAFVYYGSYDMKFPVESWMIPVITAALLGFCALFSTIAESVSFHASCRKEKSENPPDKSLLKKAGLKKVKLMPVYFLLVTLIFPLIMILPVKNDPEISIKKDSVRIMDYNIHQGFNIEGYLDLESIARVIEGSSADIVALQEVSRGWVVNGSADTYEWLAERLNMNYRLFMPASDNVWGNAILSKYPLKLLKSGFLPRLDAPLRRSYLLAEADLASNSGIDRNINIMCTHIHHIKGEGSIREEQIKAILDAVSGLERTAVMGDFNAQSGEPEIQMIHDAGFIDSQAALGKDSQLTWVHYEPYERIDYIWVTPDIEISNLFVPYSTASDHLPVVVDIR